MPAGPPSTASTCLIAFARHICRLEATSSSLFNHLLLPFCMCDGAKTISVCKLPYSTVAAPGRSRYKSVAYTCCFFNRFTYRLQQDSGWQLNALKLSCIHLDSPAAEQATLPSREMLQSSTLEYGKEKQLSMLWCMRKRDKTHWKP